MTPVALVAYQSGLTELVTAQEPPEDVTGAARAGDGGCAGGAIWLALADGAPALLGWPGAGLAGLAVPGWLGTALEGLAVRAGLTGLTVLA